MTTMKKFFYCFLCKSLKIDNKVKSDNENTIDSFKSNKLVNNFPKGCGKVAFWLFEIIGLVPVFP